MHAQNSQTPVINLFADIPRDSYKIILQHSSFVTRSVWDGGDPNAADSEPGDG